LFTCLISISLLGESASAQGIAPVATTTNVVFERNLTLGIRGNDGLALQQFLIAEGFLQIAKPTDYFGPKTRTALILWQRTQHITPPSGFFGILSRGKMNARRVIAPIIMTATPTTIATTSALVTQNGSPVRLKIPKLSVDAAFQYNGLTTDGIMEIPNNVTDVGWYTGSPQPGEKGVAITTGHVAQIRGGVITKEGVFARLRELIPGDTLSVLNDRGVLNMFIVREIRTYDPAADAHDVFTSDDDGSHLRLITCEGAWEADKQSYTKRLVVFADAVK
jgi:peptidoglycan hydrolase-like protein with peptidoglycan-binding domain